ncbi:PD-(D/E)XK nuclease superfamily protein [uncultured archaeon]|nr:PD-(D/E)XK nuclease superfamily protein [uncultured archaeon]
MSKKEYWSASRIDVANYCRMRYYLKYIEHEKSARLSAYAKGSLLHEGIEHFWDRLGTEEEVAKKKNGKKYYDGESFSKYLQGKWLRTVIGSEHTKNPDQKIAWRFEGEQWVIKNSIPGICMPLFEYIKEEGPPLFSELEFDFSLDSMRFKGYIDEVRIRDGKVVIRDFKSGSPFLGNMKVDNDPQLTFYNAGLCAKCFVDPNFSKTLGLEKVSSQFVGNPYFIYPEIEEEFFMIEALPKIRQAESESKKEAPKKSDFANEEDYKEAIKRRDRILGNIPSVILKTKRRDEHFYELIKMIKGAKEAVKVGDIYPERGRKCDICDMKYACEKKLDQVTKPVMHDKKGHMLFDFMKAPYAGPVEVNPLSENSIKQRQKQFDYRRKEAWRGR